jgi:hypothetical protein
MSSIQEVQETFFEPLFSPKTQIQIPWAFISNMGINSAYLSEIALNVGFKSFSVYEFELRFEKSQPKRGEIKI